MWRYGLRSGGRDKPVNKRRNRPGSGGINPRFLHGGNQCDLQHARQFYEYHSIWCVEYRKWCNEHFISGRNPNGAAFCGNEYGYASANPDKYAQSRAHFDGKQYTTAHQHGHPDGYIDIDSDPYLHANAYCDLHTDRDAHGFPNGYLDRLQRVPDHSGAGQFQSCQWCHWKQLVRISLCIQYRVQPAGCDRYRLKYIYPLEHCLVWHGPGSLCDVDPNRHGWHE